MGDNARIYRHIAWANGWAHERHFGWSVTQEAANFKALRQSLGAFERRLVLLDDATDENAGQLIESLRGHHPLSELIVHDYRDSLGRSGHAERLGLRKVTLDEQLLNLKTFVIDLHQDDDAALKAMTSDYRRKIKKAEAAKATFKVHLKPTQSLVNTFHEAVCRLAAKQNFRAPSKTVLEEMYAAGTGRLYEVSSGDDIVALLHAYIAADAAIFMYGVNLRPDNDGLGQYMHWRIIQDCRSIGLNWYDLGGVASTNESDGIYVFKKRFGGTFVNLGEEYILQTQMAKGSRLILSSLRKAGLRG
jgi:hypothetical protein